MSDDLFRPTTPLGWWAFGLGAAAILWAILTPFLRDRLAMALAAATLHPLLIPMAYALAGIDLALGVAALAMGILALAKGERSWMALLAFAPALLLAGFLVFRALGDVFVPR